MSALAALEADYGHLRDDVGAYWLPRDFVRLDGPEAAEYLQGQCSQDLSGLGIGESIDTLVLAPDGKVNAMARVVRIDDGVFHLDVDGGHGPPLLERLAHFKLRSKFALDNLDWSCLALRGPATPEPALLHAPVRSNVGWNGWRGVDLLGPLDEIEPPEGVPWCAEAAWEAARIESGVPVMGRELTEAVIPAEAGIVERTISFTKGCFTGQELVARIDSRGAAVPHHLAGLVIDGEVTGDLVGAELFVEGKERSVGRVTSAARCPGLAGFGALAYVHRSVEVPGRVSVRSPGGAEIAADVRPLPLV